MVFNTIRISRTILEEDTLVPIDTYKEIIGHLCLDNLYKPPLHQSLPSCSKVSCVWSAALVAEGGSVLWCPFCMFYNPACSIFYGFFCGLGFFLVFLPLISLSVASCDELGVSWDKPGYPDAEGRTAAVLFFPGEHMDMFGERLKHHCSLPLNPDQNFWTFSFTSYF